MRTSIVVALLLSWVGTNIYGQPSSELDRVEPPFWWAGMENPELQIMLYGESIAELKPVIEYDGLSINRVITAENPNYLFIDLLLSKNIKAGQFEITLLDGKKQKASYTYELKERRAGSRDRVGFSNEDVIYLVTPDRFVNGDPTNDEVGGLVEGVNREHPGGRHGGDIQGIIDKLGYLNDLGFNGVWLNPVLENNMETYSYHGYSTTDYYRIDPRYGSNDLYVEMVRIAHDKGMKIIMDMIVNHCGSEHWWMKDLPSSDWTNFGNEFVQTTHNKPSTQDPYKSEYDYTHFVDGWFVPTMPDLNQRNPLMSKYLIQNSIWWIEYADLDGIRQDTYPYPDKHFLTDWTCEIMAEYPNFNITGEEWDESPNTLAYWQQGKKNVDGYQSCLPSLLDFPLRNGLEKGLNDHLYHSYRALTFDYIYADPSKFVIFPDNHDMDRFYTSIGEDFNKFKNGIAYILTMRGTPQLYYGTELLFTNSTPDHGVIRKDYPGGWEGDEVNAFTGEGLTTRQVEARDYIKKILHWRKNSEAVHYGGLKHFFPADNIYVYFRFGANNTVMVVINGSDTDMDLDLGRYQEVLAGIGSGKDIISGTEISLVGTLSLKALTPMIIELK